MQLATPRLPDEVRRNGVIGNYHLMPSADMKTIARELGSLTGTVIDVVVQP